MDYKTYFQQKNIKPSKEEGASNLSHLIAEARLYAGITQAQLAERMGIKQPTVARAESGKQELTIKFLERVAEAVDTNLEYPKFGFMVEREKTIDQSSNVFATITEPLITKRVAGRNYRIETHGIGRNSFYDQEIRSVKVLA